MPADPAPLTSLSWFELDLLGASRALDVREADGEAVHLRLCGRRRHWLMQTPHGQFVLAADAPDLATGIDVHLPLSDRIGWFINGIHTNEPTLSIADAATAVITSDEVWAAIDLVPWHGEAPQPWDVRDVASAVLPMHRFQQTLASARVMPSGADEKRSPFPPMWMHIGDATLSLHIDWRDFLPSRATYTMAVDSVDGSGSINLPHRRIDEFLRALGSSPDHDDDTSVTVAIAEVHRGGAWHPAVSLQTPSWHFTVMAPDVLAERWADRVDDKLAEFKNTRPDSTTWKVTVGRHSINVRLHSSRPDVARVSAALCSGLHDTVELLREISTLNGASAGVRFWFEDSSVWAAMDVPCTRLADLPSAVRQVAQAATSYGPLLRALG